MPTKVSDSSCMTSDCHPKEKFLDKEVKFTEKVPFIHKTHEEKTIEGQKLHCDTCHQNITVDKHFEVTEKVCFLCHFKNTDFNEGRAKCSLCHKIPTRSLQSQKKESNPDEKPITHQSLEQAGVPCQSCHYEIIQGKGKVEKQNCFSCHNYSFEVEKKAGEKKLMHTEHVAGQHVAGQLAKCFDCHEPIQHKAAEFLDPVRLNCLTCHPDHHKYQKMLLVGDKRKGISKMPGLIPTSYMNLANPLIYKDINFLVGTTFSLLRMVCNISGFSEYRRFSVHPWSFLKVIRNVFSFSYYREYWSEH